MIKKGYVLIIVFSLFIAVAGVLKYRIFVKQDYGETTLKYLILQITILSIVFVIPGLLIVRWYYKIKKK